MIDRKMAKAFISHLLEDADEVEIEEVINAIIDLRDLKGLTKRVNLDLSTVRSQVEKDLHSRIDRISFPEGETAIDDIPSPGSETA